MNKNQINKLLNILLDCSIIINTTVVLFISATYNNRLFIIPFLFILPLLFIVIKAISINSRSYANYKFLLVMLYTIIISVIIYYG